MSDKNEFDLFDEMARGCLYRGGKSERDFLNGYSTAAIVIWSVIIVGSGFEIFIKWLL